MKGLMTVEEVSGFLHLNPVTIRRYIKAGRLRAVKVGGRIRMRREDVEEFLHPLGGEGGLSVELEAWEPIARDDPLLALVGAGRSRIKGGISGDKYLQFPRALGSRD